MKDQMSKANVKTASFKYTATGRWSPWFQYQTKKVPAANLVVLLQSNPPADNPAR